MTKAITYQTAVILANMGALTASTHTLSSTMSYRVFKFKTALRALIDKLNAAEKALSPEVGIEDIKSFNERLQELGKKESRTEDEEKEYTELCKKRDKYNDLHKALMEEKKELDCKPLPYEDWKKLMDENKEIGQNKVDLFTAFEAELEGVLWEAPEEE